MNLPNHQHLTNIELLKNVVVQQGTIREDLSTLKRMLTVALASDEGEGNAVVVTGASGSGKTTLLNRFYTEVIELKHSSASFIMTMPASPTPKDFCIALLRVIGHPYGSDKALIDAKESALKHQIEVQIKTKNIRVLIIDEFQQLTERLGEKTMRSTADMLKNWLSNFPILMIFAGTESITSLLNSNEQISSRATVIKKWSMTIGCKSDYVDYVTFLQGLNDEVGFEKVKLYLPKLALCLFIATGGDLRRIRNAITNALAEAYAQNDKHVLESHFKNTWSGAAHTFASTYKIKGNPWNKSCQDLEQLLNISYDIHDIEFIDDEAA
mgnify:CR=1 FL=1